MTSWAVRSSAARDPGVVLDASTTARSGATGNSGPPASIAGSAVGESGVPDIDRVADDPRPGTNLSRRVEPDLGPVDAPAGCSRTRGCPAATRSTSLPVVQQDDPPARRHVRADADRHRVGERHRCRPRLPRLPRSIAVNSKAPGLASPSTTVCTWPARMAATTASASRRRVARERPRQADAERGDFERRLVGRHPQEERGPVRSAAVADAEPGVGVGAGHEHDAALAGHEVRPVERRRPCVERGQRRERGERR